MRGTGSVRSIAVRAVAPGAASSAPVGPRKIRGQKRRAQILAGGAGAARGRLERYPTKLNQFDGGESVFRAGLPSPKRSFGFAQAGAA